MAYGIAAIIFALFGVEAGKIKHGQVGGDLAPAKIHSRVAPDGQIEGGLTKMISVSD